MFKTVSNVGQAVSANVLSGLHVRSGRVARVRTAATFALLVGVFCTSVSGLALADGGFNTLATSTVKNTNTAANLVTYVSYIGGAILAALGVVDLKKHVENPGQTKMKDGLAKLGFGAMLIALPYITQATMETFGGANGANVNMDTFGDKPTSLGG